MWLLAGRALYDRRHAGLLVANQSVRLLLERLPRRSIERIATDDGTPARLAGPFAVDAVRKRGARLIRNASAHRGARGRRRRVAALRMLCRAGHPRALALLERALRSEDREVAGAAVSLLGATPVRGAAELLVSALRTGLCPRSRVAARLDRFPLDVPDLVMPFVHDAHPMLRFWGATLLARYAACPEAETALLALERDPEAFVRKAAVESLGRVGGPGAATVALRLLEDPAWFVRAHAARALGNLGRDDLAERVLPLLADGHWWVRAAAKEALHAFGPATAAALAAYLRHPDEFARNGAAEVLQNLGVLDEIAGRAALGVALPGEAAVLQGAAAAGVVAARARSA